MGKVVRLRTSVVPAFSLGLLFTVGFTGFAQEKKDQGFDATGFAKQALPADNLGAKGVEEPPAKDEVFGFLQSPQGIRVATALQMMARPDPVVGLAVRIAAADSPLLWPDWELSLDAPLPLSQNLLDQIQDGTPVPNIVRRPFNEVPKADQAYYLTVSQALIYANLVPAELFQKAAERNRWITFDHLWKTPEIYRGKIIPVSGKMIRLRRWEAPRLAQQNGIEFVYEGWVVGPTAGRSPFCIVFTKLPEGLREQETMDRLVKFDGYFIKRFRYPAKGADRETNLLIGPTVVAESPVTAKVPESPFSRDVLLATIAGLFAIGVAIVLMALWFRRGDRAVQSKLASLRDQPLELGAPETTAGAELPEHHPRHDPRRDPGGPRGGYPPGR